MQKNCDVRLKELKNAYCDLIGASLGEFIDVWQADEEEILKILNDEKLKILAEYILLKNKLAGVGEVFLKVPKAGLVGEIFDCVQIAGREILSARQIDGLSARDFVGGRLMLEVESLLEYNEDYLSKIVDFCATTQTPVLIKLGQTLEEVGKIVNKFGCSPAELLEDYGFLDRECYIYGLNFIDKDDQKLLKRYEPTLILSPRSDAEAGRGAINLYNLIFNGLKFVFASEKCYNIDMFAEGKLAIYNTSNLMFERGLVKTEEILNALQSDRGELVFLKDSDFEIENLLNEKVEVDLPFIKTRMLAMREKVRIIAKEIKEKI